MYTENEKELLKDYVCQMIDEGKDERYINYASIEGSTGTPIIREKTYLVRIIKIKDERKGMPFIIEDK